jgi:hypothetical protein
VLGVPEAQVGVVNKHRVGEEAEKFMDPAFPNSFLWPIPLDAIVGSQWTSALTVLTEYQMRWPRGAPNVDGVCVTRVTCKRKGRLVATVVEGALSCVPLGSPSVHASPWFVACCPPPLPLPMQTRCFTPGGSLS